MTDGSDPTPLDQAHAAMLADPEDDAARLRYYERLADGEMFVLLNKEPAGDTLDPRIFEVDETSYVLIFDREARMSAFTGVPTPYAALPGRVIAAALAGQGVGLAVNLGAADYLVSPIAVDWLAETLAHGPDEVEARPEAFFAPAGLPERLIEGLNTKLARAGGLAQSALLVAVRYEGGRRGHMLAFVDAVEGAEPALARAVAETLTFSGIDAGEMDVAFVAGGDSVTTHIARVALRFDLPAPQVAEPTPQAAPGSDPNKPPILR